MKDKVLIGLGILVLVLMVAGCVRATPTPVLMETFDGKSAYPPFTGFTADYPTDKWQLDDASLSHLSIPGCTLYLEAGGGGVEGWEIREYDVAVPLGGYLFLRRTFAVDSTAAAPRLVAYNLDKPEGYFLFTLWGSEALDSKSNDFAVCQADAETVLATLTIH